MEQKKREILGPILVKFIKAFELSEFHKVKLASISGTIDGRKNKTSYMGNWVCIFLHTCHL